MIGNSVLEQKRIRRRLVQAQGGICALCGREIATNWHRLRLAARPSIDHVLAISLGGYDGLGNVVAAHEYCNAAKADDAPTGCDIIWLTAVCAHLDVPLRLRTDSPWLLPELRRA